IRSTDAGPVPAGWPAKGSGPDGEAPLASAPGRPAGGLAGGCAPAPADGAAAPTTCTAAWPLRAPTWASMIATPPPTPVTVPWLSTFATATLFDDQMTRTVGITFPARSNAVASSPLFSPILIVMEGGATCTSATFWASAALGHTEAAKMMTRRDIIAART